MMCLTEVAHYSPQIPAAPMTGARVGLSLETREEPKAAGCGEEEMVPVHTPTIALCSESEAGWVNPARGAFLSPDSSYAVPGATLL